jgi:hypothetical protein
MPKVSFPLTAIVLVAILVVTAIAGTVVYYNAQIASLNNQIINQKTEIANLTSQVKQISNYSDAHLEATLGVTEVGNTSENSYPFYRLYISGTVKNIGQGEALNAGLHVIAYTSSGTVEINMTVPLVSGADFGTDSSTNAFVQNWDAELGVSANPSQFGNLNIGESVTVDFNIYHEGEVTNWTVTPVWWIP